MLFPIILLFCSFGFLCHIAASERRPREPCCSMTENISLARLFPLFSAPSDPIPISNSPSKDPRSPEVLLGIHCKRKQPRGMNGRKYEERTLPVSICTHVPVEQENRKERRRKYNRERHFERRRSDGGRTTEISFKCSLHSPDALWGE